MFTGLVECSGRVASLSGEGVSRIAVLAPDISDSVGRGESVSVNGVCLTVEEVEDESISFRLMPETMRWTALGELSVGGLVNLERAMSAEGRFGGHIVQGHVDGVGEVLLIEEEGGAELWEFRAPEAVLRYVVEKGSICVEGISLTVASLGEESFTVSVLPQTKEVTNLTDLRVGGRVNLEADILGKYVERLIQQRSVRDAV
jgi:riboflavin synthase